MSVICSIRPERNNGTHIFKKEARLLDLEKKGLLHICVPFSLPNLLHHSRLVGSHKYQISP